MIGMGLQQIGQWIGLGILIGLLGAPPAGTARAAEQVPQFNVQPSCQAAAERVKSSDYASVCIQDELRARDQIQKSWAQFKPADRTRCLQLSGMGGKPTYTELLTCLELARDVRSLHTDSQTPMTTGGATSK
jgi:hypothetical protein